MIKGICGWESCNLWQSVMIWLWSLSGGAKGNHLLQHVSEIKGPLMDFWQSGKSARIPLFRGEDVTMTQVCAPSNGPGVTKQQEWMALCWSFGLCVSVSVCRSSHITSACCFIATTGATAWRFSTPRFGVSLFDTLYEAPQTCSVSSVSASMALYFLFLWNVECSPLCRSLNFHLILSPHWQHTIFSNHMSAAYIKSNCMCRDCALRVNRIEGHGTAGVPSNPWYTRFWYGVHWLRPHVLSDDAQSKKKRYLYCRSQTLWASNIEMPRVGLNSKNKLFIWS